MSMEDGKIRDMWTVGSEVQVYSVSQGNWLDACIVSVDYDREGEWLRLVYISNKKHNRRSEKQVKRYSEDVQPKVSD